MENRSLKSPALHTVINSAYQNSSSSIMQAKFLRFIEDILITPLSGLEISLSYIIGGMVRGILNMIIFGLELMGEWILFKPLSY